MGHTKYILTRVRGVSYFGFFGGQNRGSNVSRILSRVRLTNRLKKFFGNYYKAGAKPGSRAEIAYKLKPITAKTNNWGVFANKNLFYRLDELFTSVYAGLQFVIAGLTLVFCFGVCLVLGIASFLLFNGLGAEFLSSVSYPFVGRQLWGFLFLSGGAIVTYFGDVFNYLKIGGVLEINPFSAHFSKTSGSAFFQDAELLFSFTEFFSSLGLPWLNVVGVILWLVLFLVTAQLFYYFIKFFFKRGDFWLYFFNLLYYTGWTFRLPSLEFLLQTCAGSSMRTNAGVLHVDLLRMVLSGGTVDNFNALPSTTILYYFSQTYGGYAGFLDLFPTSGGFVSTNFLLNKKLKTFGQLKMIRTYLLEKFKLLGRGGSFVSWAGSAKKQARPSAERGLGYLAQPLFYYIGNQFPLVKGQITDILFLDTWRLASRIGDLVSSILRIEWFKSVIAHKYGQWIEVFVAGGIKRYSHPTKVGLSASSDASKSAWYRREVGLYNIHRRIVRKFRFNSFRRFRVGYQSVFSDFSFWRAGPSVEGQREYFSFWDSFAEDNAYSSSTLKDSRFSLFEPSAETLTTFGGGDSSDEEDSLHLDFVDSFAEMHFEDNFLHKDLPLFLFDDELTEKLQKSLPVPDEDGLSYYKEEEIEDFLNAEYLVYGSGQETDVGFRIGSAHYSRLYGIEYGDVFHYKENLSTTLYDDLADYWALHGGGELVGIITAVPVGRSPFLGSSRNSEQRQKQNFGFRQRFGRILYFYWEIFRRWVVTDYWRGWKLEFLYFYLHWNLVLAGLIYLLIVFFSYYFLEIGLVVLALGFLLVIGLSVFGFSLSRLFLFYRQVYILIVKRMLLLIFSRRVSRYAFLCNENFLRRLFNWYSANLHLSAKRSSVSDPYAGLWINNRVFVGENLVMALSPRIFLMKTAGVCKIGGFGLYNKTFGLVTRKDACAFTVEGFFFANKLSVTCFLYVSNFFFSKGRLPPQPHSRGCLVFGDLSFNKDLPAMYSYPKCEEAGGVADFLFEDFARRSFKTRLISGAPPPYSSRILLDYYIRGGAPMLFSTTLTSTACMWATHWADISFAHLQWPRAEFVMSPEGSANFGLKGSARAVMRSDSRLLGRNKTRFFRWFQRQGSYEENLDGFVGFSNFLRLFKFRQTLLWFFTLGYRDFAGVFADREHSPFAYRLAVRYTPYTLSLANLIRVRK